MSELYWKTERRKVSELIFAEKNPRKLTEKQRLDLSESLKKFDLAEIPVVTTENEIIAGNQRVKVLTMLGRSDDEIDVRVPSRQLTVEEKEEYLLRSNKNTGEWDFDSLIKDFDIDMLTDVGFTSDELHDNAGKDDPEDNGKPDKGGATLPEMEIKAFEHHDYIVLAFNNTYDWLNACQLFGIEKINVSFVKGHKKVGLGRIVDGRKLLELVGR